MDRERKIDAAQAAGICAAFIVAVWLFAPDLAAYVLHAITSAWVAVFYRTAHFVGLSAELLLAVMPVVVIISVAIASLSRDGQNEEL